MAQPPRSNDEAETYHRGRRALLAAAMLGAMASLRWRPFRVEIAGDSMRPTLEPGDWAIATPGGRVRTGHVVVLQRPDRPGLEVVKRVCGEEPAGLVVLGDNPAASTDSRHFGPVPGQAITGRVRLVYWPPRRWRLL
jgi:nickel-type superoxide dismutase maturation protease